MEADRVWKRHLSEVALALKLNHGMHSNCCIQKLEMEPDFPHTGIKIAVRSKVFGGSCSFEYDSRLADAFTERNFIN